MLKSGDGRVGSGGDILSSAFDLLVASGELFEPSVLLTLSVAPFVIQFRVLGLKGSFKAAILLFQ